MLPLAVLVEQFHGMQGPIGLVVSFLDFLKGCGAKSRQSSRMESGKRGAHRSCSKGEENFATYHQLNDPESQARPGPLKRKVHLGKPGPGSSWPDNKSSTLLGEHQEGRQGAALMRGINGAGQLRRFGSVASTTDRFRILLRRARRARPWH